MPSSEPWDTTIDTLRMGSAGIAVSARSAVAGTAVVIMTGLLDAAFGFRNAADLGGELRGALGKKLIELLHRHAGVLAEGADGRRRAGLEVGGAHEVDHQPVAVVQIREPALARDLERQILVPLLRFLQEALGVDLDGRVQQGDYGHVRTP